MKIYTRTGDQGTTSLADGTRLPKGSARIEAYGTVDEANSWIGAARSFVDDGLLDGMLAFVQHRFYNCSSNLASSTTEDPAPVGVDQRDIDFLERAIDQLTHKSGKIEGFILPGGGRAAGMLHIARTVCRRAERRIWTLAETSPVDSMVVKFVNRASDLLFAGARYANIVEGTGDVMWQKELPQP